MTPLGLYVHIPFCLAKCAYCDFNSYADLQLLHLPYVQALCTEIGRCSGRLDHSAVDTIFFGGGTPTVLPPAALLQVLAACRDLFVVSVQAEITVEANPGTVGLPGLSALRHGGVNRLSLGAQSFRDRELRLLGRVHSAQQTLEAFRYAREAGFDNINLDLIYGLPGQSIACWRDSLSRALDLAPEHLSLYALTLEEETPLWRRIRAGSLPKAPDPDLAAEMYEVAREELCRLGYAHYELSNWAGPKNAHASPTNTSCGLRDTSVRCQHNLKYWTGQPYLGLGAGAHSFLNGTRYANVERPEDYIARIEGGADAQACATAISADEELAEAMILGLRLVEGVRFSTVCDRLGRDVRAEYADQLAELVTLELVTMDNTTVRLTPRGQLLANQVFLRFWPPRQPSPFAVGATPAADQLNADRRDGGSSV
jgi:oxygen-independent coproporphyrinogen-3 oxidase